MQKQHQLTIEEHVNLMDMVCLWLYVAPKLKAEVSADVFEHYEAMFADGCPGQVIFSGLGVTHCHSNCYSSGWGISGLGQQTVQNYLFKINLNYKSVGAKPVTNGCGRSMWEM